MLHETRRKMELLYFEVKGAVTLGPSGQVASDLRNPKAKVIMYDATSLTRELLPEVALQVSRNQVRPGAQHHVLEYVTLRITEEYVVVTEAALDGWLQANGGVRHEMQVRSAIDVLRKSVASLSSQESKKRALRHLRLINQELIAS